MAAAGFPIVVLRRIVLNWNSIDVVLLDMDGTLLDLHFDDYFWREHVPRRLSEKNGTPLEQTRQLLIERYRAMRGTLEWYSVDYWSSQLGLDIGLLAEELIHLIAVQPYVPEFLDRVRWLGKKTVLVTNAHRKSISLKMKHTRIGGSFDRLVCAHDLGLPKENPAFWDRLRDLMPFEKGSTLLVDDNLDVLESARQYGIGHLVSIVQPNSRRPPRLIEGFGAIVSFGDILPQLNLSPAAN